MAKLLIIEDDEVLSEMLADCLLSQRHIVEVEHDGQAGLERLKSYKYDLLIVDVELPGLNGIEICRDFKLSGAGVPVLMLTARASIDDKEKGFDAGADDYLSKPVRVQEFLARVRALLRRSGINDDNTEFQIRGIRFQARSGILLRDNMEVQLPPKEAQLLELLLKQKDQYLDSKSIIFRMWGDEGTRASLSNCLKRLRKKLCELGEPDLIETVSGLGYRLK